MDTAITPSVDVLQPLNSSALAVQGKSAAQMKKTAQDFEATFISQMLGPMFDGVGEGQFSGGEGEDMFKSFMMDAMAKQMAKAGGIGLAGPVQQEMLKLQGLKG